MICLGALRGSDNPFAGAGLPDADPELMKADLATAIVCILRERDLTRARRHDRSRYLPHPQRVSRPLYDRPPREGPQPP